MRGVSAGATYGELSWLASWPDREILGVVVMVLLIDDGEKEKRRKGVRESSTFRMPSGTPAFAAQQAQLEAGAKVNGANDAHSTRPCRVHAGEFLPVAATARPIMRR